MDDPTPADVKALIDQLIDALAAVANSQEHPSMNLITAVVMQEFGKQQTLIWEEHQVKNGADPATLQKAVAGLRECIQSCITVVDLTDER